MSESQWKMRYHALDIKMLHFRDRVAWLVSSCDQLKDTLHLPLLGRSLLAWFSWSEHRGLVFEK